MTGARKTSPLGFETDLGKYEAEIEKTLARLSGAGVVNRVWRKDHTVWKPEPVEITNRLGWLTVVSEMRIQVPALRSFAREVCDAGFRYVVLLGMGGSSLGAEVLRQVFGNTPGFPQLFVLDSTLPSTIKAVAGAIDPAHTLFIVSSKSGTTTEPLILYRYFRSLVEKIKGKDTAANFVAITDPATPLAKMGAEQKFRAVFLNPPDIGGRYSVLSLFGLVPAALIGIDIEALLERAAGMAERCRLLAGDNPGFWLGVCIGTLALQGRDKLTLVTSPSLGSFGLWVEQLVAESTGKDSKGIIPVTGEPLLPDCYGSDRLFIYLRLKNDKNRATDTAVNALKKSGQPVVVLDVPDRVDLGAEFFRWEFATAIAGAVLGIHPFNQPDVAKAKSATERILRGYVESGNLPRVESSGTLSGLMAQAKPGDYFAIMAYLHQTPQMDKLLTSLRRRIMERHHIATTLGYGPRFLHSTGQLHKGGPCIGMFLQITAEHRDDMPVLGEPYTFGTVADAQALGDLQALQAEGRRVVSLRIARDNSSVVRKLLNEIWRGSQSSGD